MRKMALRWLVKGRSVKTNLTCFTQSVTEAIDARIQMNVVYLDFSKAFDRLGHSLLLNKFNLLGLSLLLLKLFECYLIGRKQQVTCCGYNSFIFDVFSGVP